MADEQENGEVLNAMRSVIREDAPSATTPAPAPSASVAATGARAEAFNWKVLLPWLLGALVLILLVWILTRRGGASAPVVIPA